MTIRPDRLRFSNNRHSKDLSPLDIESEVIEPPLAPWLYKALDQKQLETTARGVAKARQAFAIAIEQALEAEVLHTAHLQLEIATLKAELRQSRIDLYGHGYPIEATEAIEAEESRISAQAELNLEGLGLA